MDRKTELARSLKHRIEETSFEPLYPDIPIPILIPEDTPLELQLRLIAAVKSYLLRVKSMDRTYKKYKDSWEAQIERWGYDGRLS